MFSCIEIRTIKLQNLLFKNIHPLNLISNYYHKNLVQIHISLINSKMKCVLVLFVTIFWYLLQCRAQIAKTRIWIPNTNYDEPKNWLKHKLPCEGSKIIFPEDLNAAIYLPNNIKVKEIDLPNEGELIIKPEGKLEVTGKDDFRCDRKEVHFKKLNIEPWLKPSNWKSDKVRNIATPHVERVPCIYDNVVFPNKSSFWVQYPEISISVNSFTIEGKSLSDAKLQDFLLSEPGDRQFRNFDYQYRTDVINVKENKCSDKSGCLCHDSEFIKVAVCKNLQQICRETHCLDPVQPNGHCCKFCGAYLKLKFDINNFNLVSFNSNIMAHLNVYGYNDIDTHISKALFEDDTYIQIVIVEKDFKYNGDSISAAQDLHNLFVSDPKQYNLLNSELFISGSEYYPGQQLRRTVALVLGSLFLVLISLTIIYIKYETEEGKKFNLPGLSNLKNFSPFIFVKFENTGDGDTGLEFRNRSVASSLFNMDRAFDNPMYDAQVPSTSQRNEENNDEKLGTDFQNPLYSDLKEKVSKEDIELEE